MLYRNRIIEKLRYSNWLRLIFDTAAKFGVRITPYFVALEGEWDDGPPELEAGFDAYQCRRLSIDDMGPLSQIPGRPISERQLIQRLHDGHLCFGLVKDGRVVSFSWVNPQEALSGLCRFSLQAHEAYYYDLYTLHAFRGRQLALYLRHQTYRHLLKLGLTRYYSVIDALNTPAVKFKRKLQARFIYTGVSIKLFKRYEYNFPIKQLSGFDKRIR